jgi:hypothetical protein
MKNFHSIVGWATYGGINLQRHHGGIPMSRSIAGQVESLRQAAVDYALGGIADAMRQASFLKIPLPEVLSAMAGADASITSPAAALLSSTRNILSPGMKELLIDDFEFAKLNLIRAAWELRNLGWDSIRLHNFITQHLSCDQADHDHDHDHPHVEADTGDDVEPATELRPKRLVM